MSRPGGYTRIHKFGHRQGDHAPHAILELVDGPRDLKFAMTARAVGRETASSLAVDQPGRSLREQTKMAVEKVLKFRGEEGREAFERLSQKHAVSLSF
jgi:large subunit ribosomal protein L17